MKSVLAAVAAASVASLAFYAFSSRSNAELRRAQEAERQAWQQKESALEQALAAARRQPAVVQAASASLETVVISTKASPEEALAQLIKLKASSRDPSIRRVIYHMEQLREIGAPSVPVIAAFLDRFEDISYMELREQDGDGREGRSGRGGPGGGDDRGRPEFSRRRSDVRLSFATPPSLRIGLFDVLQGIGGEAAEKALAKTLGETGRAVEIAYLAKVLQEMAPSKYAALAAGAARDLLLNPSGEAGDRLDENAKDYLYDVLAKTGDKSFAPTAQTMIVGADGRIDRHALTYVHESLKELAMPALFAAYNDPRLTNQWEKASLLQLALNYAGPNQQANEMLNSVIGNDALPAQMRAMALIQLTRGEPTPETLRARLPVVEALKGSTQDERMLRTLDVAYQNIQSMLAGNKIDESSWRTALRGDRPDRGGNRIPGEGRGNRQ